MKKPLPFFSKTYADIHLTTLSTFAAAIMFCSSCAQEIQSDKQDPLNGKPATTQIASAELLSDEDFEKECISTRSGSVKEVNGEKICTYVKKESIIQLLENNFETFSEKKIVSVSPKNLIRAEGKGAVSLVLNNKILTNVPISSGNGFLEVPEKGDLTLRIAGAHSDVSIYIIECLKQNLEVANCPI